MSHNKIGQKPEPLTATPADLAQIKKSKEFRRYNLLGLRFGPSKVRGLRLEVVDFAEHGGKALRVQAKVGNTWKTVKDQQAVDAITVRHIDDQCRKAAFTLQLQLPGPSVGWPELARPASTKASGSSAALSVRTSPMGGSRASSSDSPSQPASVGSELSRRNALRRRVGRAAKRPPAVAVPLVVDVRPKAAPLGVGDGAATPQFPRTPSEASSASSLSSSSSRRSSADSVFERGSALSTDATSGESEATRSFGATADAYLASMRQPSTYGSDLEVAALAKAFNRPISLLQEMREFDSAGKLRMAYKHHYFAAAQDNDTSPIYLVLEGGGHGKNSAGNHFVPLDVAGRAIPASLPTLQALPGQKGQADADGSCLFHAIGQQVGLGKAEVRAIAVRALEDALDGIYGAPFKDDVVANTALGAALA